MPKVLRQACGYEPESLWMSILGMFCALLMGPALILTAVAFGWGG
jgi:hypothetical protein